MSGNSMMSVGNGCPTRSELSAFLNGDTPNDASVEIEAHVLSCPHCIASVDELEEKSDIAVQALATLPASNDDELEFQRVQSELLAQSSPSPGSGSSFIEQSAIDQPIERSEPPVPTQLGAYKLLEKIGRGATGTVYRVQHQKLERIFAMKVLHREDAADADCSGRFLSEMKAIGRLDHPHIVRATDAGEDQGYQYLVMEYSPGLDISEILRRLGPLSIPDACEIARQAALGLQHAHQFGVIHRDVKPSNLLLTSNGQVKLLDLGLVAVRHGTLPGDAEQNPRGTADYMAPEQWIDYAHVDERADLYSLGCALFKMMSGIAPFHPLPDQFPSKMQAHLSAAIPRLSALRSGAPPELEQLLVRLLAKRPEDRYQTAAALLSDLTPLAEGADLQSLAHQLGLRSSDSYVAADIETGTPKASTNRRVARRTMLLGGAAAASLAAIYGRRFWTPVPKVATDSWRPLAPVSSELLLSLDDDAKWSYEPADASIAIRADRYALVNLGQPLVGAFSVRTAFSLLSEDCRAGVFFRHHSRVQNQLPVQDFHLVEYIPNPGDGLEENILQWSYVLTRGTGSEHQFETKQWAWTPVFAPGKLVELEIMLGLDGFPGIIWCGKRLPESVWVLTSDGREKTQISNERLRADYRGRLGVVASNGSAKFYRPQLMYHKLD
ncbi:MAG TPA: serine/threonine-protein kinase [Lacipirellulaceae bacterium]|nr:serine/threonine-protein kinase [Lacipirellulaceae bacterium]